MDELANIWPKRITVDKRIVSVLSQSTYDNFPRALKELITNSYDADAKLVNISINLEKETIIIEDTGSGMNASDFEFYLRIAGKTRKKENNKSPFGREILGQFGIGFLAVFPFFKNYSIETTKSGSSDVLKATIPLSKYFTDQKRLIDVGSIVIEGGTTINIQQASKSFTKITLTGFNDLTRSFFYPKVKAGKSNKVDRNLVESYEGIDKLKWILSDDLPLKFEEERFNKIFSLENESKFDVFVNGDQLKRKVYGNEILETHSGEFKQIGNIKVKYVITTPRRSVKPYEGRFLKIRNLNVGVGDQREHFGIARGATRSRIQWLTGEVHIIEGMNDLIKISRDGFNYSNDFENLKVFFNTKLNYFSNQLEEEAELMRDIKQTEKEFRVSNIKLLNPGTINEKLKKFKKAGYEVKSDSNGKDTPSISDQNKKIIIPTNFEKHIIINKKRYRVTVEKWDYKDSKFPACKLEKSTIILNSNYPLFRGKKFTDVFVKLHVLLLINYENKVLSSSVFKTLLDDILIYYSDY